MKFAAVAGCWGVAALALGAGAIALCPAGWTSGRCAVPPFDAALLQLLHTAQQPARTGFFAAVTWLGSMWVLLPSALLLAFYFYRHGHARAALLPPLALLGAWLLAHAGKLLVQRPRPDLFSPLITMPSDLSFPSAHAMQVAAFGVGLVLAPGIRRYRAAVFAMLLLVLLVALSRLYLQVHFPSDVLAGLIAGAAWALGLQQLLTRRS